jgi:hypothetical protein
MILIIHLHGQGVRLKGMLQLMWTGVYLKSIANCHWMKTNTLGQV